MQHKTLPLMGARRPASGKAAAIILVEFVFAFFLYPDARRVAPICACVHWLHSLRMLSEAKAFFLLQSAKAPKPEFAFGSFYIAQILRLVP